MAVKNIKLTRSEELALKEVYYYTDAPYFQKPKTMTKLAKKGLVRPHPKAPGCGFAITANGKKWLKEMGHDIP